MLQQPDDHYTAPANLGTAVYANNADTIGNTPLVRLNHIMPQGVTVLAKIESRNRFRSNAESVRAWCKPPSKQDY